MTGHCREDQSLHLLVSDEMTITAQMVLHQLNPSSFRPGPFEARVLNSPNLVKAGAAHWGF